MFLFHGSNIEVPTPKILISNRMLDFGSGFYTTSSEPQAIKWSKTQTYRRGNGRPVVTVYQFDDSNTKSLLSLRFYSANQEWLHYVTENRKGIYAGTKYDLVIGPVANDNTMPVLNDYMSGAIDEQTALILLKPQKLADQYAFLTYKALSLLKCVEVKYYD